MKNFHLRIPDRILYFNIISLAALGLILVYSASSVIAIENFSDSFYYFKRQLVFMLLGLGLMHFCMKREFQTWIKLGPLALIVSFILLALLFVPGLGLKSGIATRWLDFGIATFQPAELGKLAIILFAVSKLTRDPVSNYQNKVPKHLIMPVLVMTLIMCFLVFRQPDFGSASIILFLSVYILFFAGIKMRYLWGGLLLLAPMLLVLLLGQDYRRKRILAFLNPWEDPSDVGYQIVQSFAAFHSGGIWGVGLGNSKEKLFFLPEAHTDFIFAVIGEELGLFGALAIILAFAVIAIRGFRIAKDCPDFSGKLLAAGCTCFIVFQALLNIFVVTGMLPTKGLPLPFVSYGGSSLVMSFIACGILFSVANYNSKFARKSGMKKSFA